MSPRFSLLNIRSFFSVAAIFIAIASYGQSNVVPDNVELAALRNIYDSLVGSGWTTKTNWPTAATWPASATSSQFGTWYGVTVSNGDINKISLAANNVTGQLPRSIGSLTKLKYLYLENNSITGSIPDTYGNFTGMLNFHLNNNQLTGSIPSSLGNLSTATHLRLQSNSLTGSIPASIGNLTQLTDFMVNSNQLSGPIPGTLGNLVNVEYFYLYGNQLTGAIPSSLGGLNSVHYFNINTNQLTGGIPASFSNLDEMILFDISTNQLSGEFPGVINGWLNMTQLKLNNNQFTGDFPAAISGCQALTLIAGQNNQFTSLPTALLSLPLVVTLSFYGNELTTIPDLSTHSNKTNLTLQVQNNRLDFNMLQLIYQKGIKTVSYDPQKALNDLLYLRVSPGGKLVIQSRGAGTGGTYSWERKLEGSSSWVNVNALNEDASAKTFTKSSFQNTDDGQFRYKMTNSLFSSSFSISSAAIAVRVSEFEAVWNSETGVKDVKGIISKTAAAGWGNAGALSENSLPANTDGWFEFTTNASSNYLLGFSLASNVSTALDGVEYGLEVSSTNQKIYAHESSVTGIDLGSWVSGDYFKIARIGSTLKYYKNGSEIRSVTVLPNKEYVLKAAINSGTVPAINNSFWLSTSRGAVPDAWEYMALKDFYDSLGGAGWSNKANWPTSPIAAIATTAAIMDTWNGITTVGGDITRIDLFSNHMVGVIPSSISRLKKLNTLRVQNNLITGKIPEALSQLSEMNFLNLAINGISGTIPESLGNLSNLTWLGLYQLPSLSGPLPASLFILPKLENFYIYYTNVSGSIPAVVNLPKIKVMYLYRNKLTGSLPESLAAQTTLTNLAIEGNPSMNGPLPPTIGALVNLTELWFNESSFSGPIPSSIGSLTKLLTLNLFDNQLEGTIPSSLGNLVNLRWVALNKNNLSGTIPDVFGQMTKLDSLWLNHNQLSGTIPASMKKLNSLARLSLNSNQLSGAIPKWLDSLTHLKYITLDSNRFSSIGAINFQKLASLKQFNLKNNKISSLPSFSGTTTAKLDVSNNFLDFHQLLPLKNINTNFVLTPQKNISDLTDVEIEAGSQLMLPSRELNSSTTISWFKKNGVNWDDVTVTSEDGTHKTFLRANSIMSDKGSYYWSTTDTEFPGVVIRSESINVKGNFSTPPQVSDVTGCAGSSFTLVASGEGTIHWFSDEKDGYELSSGPSFVTPSLTESFVYYVSQEIDGYNSKRVPLHVSVTPIPSLDFTFTKSGQNYTFTPQWSGASNQCSISYQWNFGDGTNSSSSVASHSYHQQGDVTVSLSASYTCSTCPSTVIQASKTVPLGVTVFDGIYSDGEGNVSVGTQIGATGYRLSVKGKMIMEGIQVMPRSLWPDYVFEASYQLPQLKEVKRFINRYKHLPGIPSSIKVAQQGIDAGEMGVLLLKQTEELTLHLIRLDERLRKLESKQNKK